VATTGFMRAGDAKRSLPLAQPGPPWSYEQADAAAHEFLIAVAGERDIYEYVEDPVEHARVNALMLLFNEEVTSAFATYLARMPPPRAQAWRDLISGGVSAEVFGPLTLQEKIDERRFEAHLRAARRKRIVAGLLAGIAMLGIVVGGYLLWGARTNEELRETGALNFGALSEPTNQAALGGGPPIVEPALTAKLTESFAVTAGDAQLALRIGSIPAGAIPYPQGALQATLFQYAGSGHVLFVGPSGFVERSCLRASVVTEDLRPLDVVTSGPCSNPVGRSGTIGCVGPTALLLDLRVASGVVELPEGGSGIASAVRVQLVGEDARYQMLSLRATIEVRSGEDVAVPRFGAAPGEELTFDLGDGVVGSCIVTGDLPS